MTSPEMGSERALLRMDEAIAAVEAVKVEYRHMPLEYMLLVAYFRGRIDAAPPEKEKPQ